MVKNGHHVLVLVLVFVLVLVLVQNPGIWLRYDFYAWVTEWVKDCQALVLKMLSHLKNLFVSKGANQTNPNQTQPRSMPKPTPNQRQNQRHDQH